MVNQRALLVLKRLHTSYPKHKCILINDGHVKEWNNGKEIDMTDREVLLLLKWRLGN